MKKTFLFSLILFSLVFSCTKDANYVSSLDVVEETASLEDFSILLSKAVYAEPELRGFIKREALEKRDYDYDVFYPFVKDKVVSDGRTFEELLKKYDSNNVLTSVVNNHPLLTILVPDWAWIKEDCFSVKTWDTSIQDVGVSYLSASTEHQIFWNGEYAFSIVDGEFITAPLLIVKDNDRLVAAPGTKGSVNEGYQFYCDDFVDLSSNINTKTTSEYTTYDLTYATASDRVTADKLTGRVRTAYSHNNADARVYQRDHIYYGMTAALDSGVVNKNYYETLYRFKLSPNALGLFDDPLGTGTGHDFKTNTYYYLANTWGQAESIAESNLKSTIWGEGSAEIKITIHLGEVVLKKNASVSFSDAFFVKKVEMRENYNWLGSLRSRTYYLGVGNSGNNDEWLEPKWIDSNLQLFYWDLYTYPTSYLVEFEEYDASTKTSRTVQGSYSRAHNFKISADVDLSTILHLPLKLGFGYGLTSTTTNSVSTTVETTQESDNLGNFIVQYTDKVVLHQIATFAQLKTYSTGDVDAQILVKYE